MSDLIAQGWVSTREAAKLTGYTADYVRQLIKREHITAQKVGRDWLVNLASLLAYKREMDRLGTTKHNPWRGDLAAQERAG